METLPFYVSVTNQRRALMNNEYTIAFGSDAKDTDARLLFHFKIVGKIAPLTLAIYLILSFSIENLFQFFEELCAPKRPLYVDIDVVSLLGKRCRSRNLGKLSSWDTDLWVSRRDVYR